MVMDDDGSLEQELLVGDLFGFASAKLGCSVMPASDPSV